MSTISQNPLRIALAVAFCAVLVFHGTRESTAQVATTKTTSIFKKSYIAAWFDGPDDYKSYDVDVLFQDMQIVTEQEVPKWHAFARKMQHQGKLFCTQLHPITHLGKILQYVMNDPGMQSAVCLDFDGRQYLDDQAEDMART